MDQTGAEILTAVLGVVVIVFGFWWKFVRGRETDDATVPLPAAAILLGVRGRASVPSAAVIKARAPQILKGFGWVFLIFALAAALGSGIRFGMRYHFLQSQLKTRGQIVSSEIYSTERWSCGRFSGCYWGTLYGFRCTVEYPVGGRQYQSIADLGTQTGFRSSIEKWPARFPPGSAVLIAYDPIDPTSVTLAGDFRFAYASCFLGLWLLITYLSAGLLFLAVSRKLSSRSNLASPLKSSIAAQSPE